MSSTTAHMPCKPRVVVIVVVVVVVGGGGGVVVVVVAFQIVQLQLPGNMLLCLFAVLVTTTQYHTTEAGIFLNEHGLRSYG